MQNNFSSSQEMPAHPSNKTWMEYLYGECNLDVQKSLKSHLTHCPSCQRQVELWRNMQHDLSSWKIGNPSPQWVRQKIDSWLRWGIAALLVLGIGILIGRTTYPGIDKVALIREIIPQIQEAIVNKSKLEPSAAIEAQALVKLKSEFLSEITQAYQEQTATIAAKLVADHQEKSIAQLIEMLDRRQTANFAYLTTYLENLEKQYDASLISIRKDLETLALTTENEFWKSRRNISQLASMTQIISPQDANHPTVPQNEKSSNSNP